MNLGARTLFIGALDVPYPLSPRLAEANFKSLEPRRVSRSGYFFVVTLRIGDTLTEGEDLNFEGAPNFAPENLRRVRLPDVMRAKKLKQALQQLA